MKGLITCAVALGLAGSAMAAQPGGGVSIQSKGTKPIAGAVNANGTPQLSPTTFTVSHPTAGRYIITFKTAFAKDAICVFTPVGGAVRVAGLGISKTTCDVTFVSTASGAVTDSLFSFIASNAG